VTKIDLLNDGFIIKMLLVASKCEEKEGLIIVISGWDNPSIKKASLLLK